LLTRIDFTYALKGIMSYMSLIDPVSQIRARNGTMLRRNNTTPGSAAIIDENTNSQQGSSGNAPNKSEHQMATDKENKEHPGVDDYNEREDNLSNELVKSGSTIGYKKGTLVV
jgi:hypothetical protein